MNTSTDDRLKYTPRVAVVIPVFRQPSLVIEAMESSLRQKTPFDYRVVVVNDGCPFAETDDVCRRYARAYPERIRYVRRPNGGLSAARNTGAEYALATWPSVEAVQMLDADDRLGERALEMAVAGLERHPDAGWVFPNCRRFGFSEEYVDVGGPWSVLELLVRNYVMCASMVRRTVFERGLRYDEQMRLGYEDWDFWIQCVEAGLRGVHLPEMDFQYRKRAESMLGDVARDHAQVIAYMRRKHAGLYSLRHAITLEQSEAPRFAIYIADEGRIVLTSDPACESRSISVKELVPALSRHMTEPQKSPFPPCFVVTTRAFLQTAAAGRFVRGLFWMLQNRIQRAKVKIAAVSLMQRPGLEYCFELTRAAADNGEPPAEPAVIVTSPQLLHECLLDASGEWLRRMGKSKAETVIERTVVRFESPLASVNAGAGGMQGLVDLVDELRRAYRAEPSIKLTKGRTVYRLEHNATDLTRQLFDCGPLYPYVADRSRIQIGYVIPICEFGGAERVALNFARESRRRGWAPHLFVIGSSRAAVLGEFKDVCESLTVVEDPDSRTPGHLLGLLGTMDVVVNNNCWLMNPALSLLRRAGVKVFSHIHSVTALPGKLPYGQPYESLRHEHSLDGIIVISRKLYDWCRAWGVPEAKLIHVPNAASFEMSDALVETTLIERSERGGDRPLNVLFLGRFDQEKGMDRLVALYQAAAREGPVLNWQIAGRRVLASSGHASDDWDVLQPFIRPPALTAAALSRLYRWADVLIMLSRFEGVPLTILEAQRLGCVVLSTNVGAIDELIEHDRTGFLFDNSLDTPELVTQMLHRLSELGGDRNRLMQVSRAAAEVRRKSTWTACFEPFARFVESLLPGKSGGR